MRLCVSLTSTTWGSSVRCGTSQAQSSHGGGDAVKVTGSTMVPITTMFTRCSRSASASSPSRTYLRIRNSLHKTCVSYSTKNHFESYKNRLKYPTSTSTEAGYHTWLADHAERCIVCWMAWKCLEKGLRPTRLKFSSRIEWPNLPSEKHLSTRHGFTYQTKSIRMHRLSVYLEQCVYCMIVLCACIPTSCRSTFSVSSKVPERS